MTKRYHLWISGCQMNYADARLVTNRLEQLGYRPTNTADEADVILLQTCTVRQQAEDKAHGRLQNLRPLKEARPDLTLAMMGCVVGVKGSSKLEEQYPYVDVWMPPASDGLPLISHLNQDYDQRSEALATESRHALQNEQLTLAFDQKGILVSAPVAAVYGCSHACTFCIIPNKRGIERTRPVDDILVEVRQLVEKDVKEVVLLGQIIDRYGSDIDSGPDLADLLLQVSKIDGLDRVRFLTSHPNYMSDRILEAVADIPKVMPQIEVPIQAGDDQVQANMKRGYTSNQYRELVEKIRTIVPDAAVHNDIIVGFPGETEEQFKRTYALLEELEFDKVHIAKYSSRKGTVSARRMTDDVPDIEKRRRHQALEELQKSISTKRNARWMGEVVEVLVEDKQKGRWRGRSPQGKLVFFDDKRQLRGSLVKVQITHTGPWSMSGTALDSLASAEQTTSVPLTVF